MPDRQRVNILTIGSRGDVQPYMALGSALARAGHPVTLSSAPAYGEQARALGLDFHPINAEFLALAEAQGAVEGKAGLGLIKQVKPSLRKMLDDAWAGAQGADAVVYHPKTLGGADIAEALGIPGLLAVPAPLFTPTRAWPVPLLPPTWRLGGALNRWSYALSSLAAVPFADVLNDWRRRTLGRAERPARFDPTARGDGRPVPVLYAYSPSVVPDPADWPPHVHATGFWFLESPGAWSPPAALTAFLAAGPAPVYVGFGSMTTRDAAAKTRLVLEAVRLSGQRAVLARGWGGLEVTEAPDGVFMLDEAPHDWLFPRMAAVVHHGGAGTTAAGLRAGRPTVICPFFGDQAFWGHRIHVLGAGPRPLPQRRLTAEALGAAIRHAATDTAIRERAEALGRMIRAEDGTGRAVAIIREVIAWHPR